MPGVKQRGTCHTMTRWPFQVRTDSSSHSSGGPVGISAPRSGGFPVPTGPFGSPLTTAAQGPFFHGCASVPVPGRRRGVARAGPSAHLSRRPPLLARGAGKDRALTLGQRRWGCRRVGAGRSCCAGPGLIHIQLLRLSTIQYSSPRPGYPV